MTRTVRIGASRAILAAFAHLGVRRIALATPYSEAVEALGATYWKAAGLEVVTHRRLEGVTNIYDETEGRAYELGRRTDMRAADALSGTGLPTAGIVQRLEDELGRRARGARGQAPGIQGQYLAMAPASTRRAMPVIISAASDRRRAHGATRGPSTQAASATSTPAVAGP